MPQQERLKRLNGGIDSTTIAPGAASTSSAASAASTSATSVTDAACFLQKIWRWDEAKPWERYWLRGPDGDWRIAPGEDLEGIAAEITQQVGDLYYSPHAYLPRSGRGGDAIVQLNAVVVDLDDPALDLNEAKQKLAQLGLKPHYVVATSPGKWQLVFILTPIRLGKRSREGVLRRVGLVMRSLAKLVGGDPNAAKPNQLFRLPGTRRQLDYGTWTVSIREEHDHLAYPLGRLERALRLKRGLRRRRARANDTQPTTRPQAGILDSPPIRWLREHVIAEGSRNTALVALTKAYLNAGIPLEQAERELCEWVSSNTVGPYPHHQDNTNKRPDHRDPRAVIRAVYNSTSPRRERISPKVLQTIRDINGKTIPPGVANTITKYTRKTTTTTTTATMTMTQTYKPRPVPPERLKHKALVWSLYHAIKTLIQLQQKNRGHPITITVKQLAALAGIPLSTAYQRVFPTLRELGIAEKTRDGRTWTHIIDLRKAPSSTNAYVFVNSKLWTYSPVTVLRYWWRRWGEVVRALIALLKQLPVLLGRGHCKTPTVGHRTLPPTRMRTPGPRGPPPRDVRGVIEGQATALSWTPPTGGVSRARERWENRAKLLREWSRLPHEEIARRIEARREIARRWQEERA